VLPLADLPEPGVIFTPLKERKTRAGHDRTTPEEEVTITVHLISNGTPKQPVWTHDKLVPRGQGLLSVDLEFLETACLGEVGWTAQEGGVVPTQIDRKLVGLVVMTLDLLARFQQQFPHIVAARLKKDSTP
jgi:hypothetical protein